jgi:hypothetical protein
LLRAFAAPWLRTTEMKALIVVGALWLVLTFAFESNFGQYAIGRSWADLASDYTFSRFFFWSGWRC